MFISVYILCNLVDLYQVCTNSTPGAKTGPAKGVEVFHVYLNKFEISVSHLFLIIFSNNKFTLVNLISRNAQSPRK